MGCMGGWRRMARMGCGHGSHRHTHSPTAADLGSAGREGLLDRPGRDELREKNVCRTSKTNQEVSLLDLSEFHNRNCVAPLGRFKLTTPLRTSKHDSPLEISLSTLSRTSV